ncbi:MAG TPA: DCC1-like thiol-disulfide oxidoreductase family protein [Hyphomicrobiaceae bacterium]|nr:DCC1-like thiol-disulfide oxidoreductase family protein [Hyphomicrobiaceae bacterium]
MTDRDRRPVQRVSGRPEHFPAYSYRADAAVPSFPDDKALIVFDGMCVLCSGFAKFILKHDKHAAFRLTTAQSPLGQALYRHYGLDTEAFESNLVLVEGRVHTKLDTVAAVGHALGGPWRALALVGLLPRALGNWLYDRVAQSRYALFGRTESCMLPPPQWRDRFIN